MRGQARREALGDDTASRGAERLGTVALFTPIAEQAG